METAKAQKNKFVAIGIVSVLLMLTLVGSAYAYSTSVTSNGDISGSYITVDVIKKDGTSTSAITTPLRNIIGADGTYTYDSTAPDSYYIHVESNSYDKAWVYGYFSIGTGYKGVLIKSITLRLETVGDVTLVRDSYTGSFGSSSIPLTSDSDGRMINDLQITKIKVEWYTDFDSATTVNITLPDGTSTQISIGDAKSLENLSFTFHASPTDLLKA